MVSPPVRNFDNNPSQYKGRGINAFCPRKPPLNRVIHADEGLTLETSVFESFTVANLTYPARGW